MKQRDLYLPKHDDTRGLRPFEEPASPWPTRAVVALGVLGMVAGGIFALALRRQRKRSFRGRIERVLPW